MSTVIWCTHCLNMSTRPRIEFDERGWCNACQWMEEKQTMDWSRREAELERLLDSYRSKDKSFDCVVPCSGGKDGSYISYTLASQYGMHPLTVTVKPPLSLELGNRNLENFINSGFNHVLVTPHPRAMQLLNKSGFVEKGFPYYGWLTAIHTAVLRVALAHDVRLIFYGEDGEVEYGGSTETKNSARYDVDYQRKIYLEAGYDSVISSAGLSDQDMYFFTYPELSETDQQRIHLTHWSYYEPWDPYRNYLVAKDHCGLEEQAGSNSGTFTNFAQNDQALYSLHTYMMYLKFGFGRATQDAGIEIRRGAMDREQAIELVRIYDGHYPNECIDAYLDYFKMTKEEFDEVLDRWANKQLFEKIKGIWKPKFEVGVPFECR